MKSRILIIISLFSIVFASCKKEADTEKNTEKTEAVEVKPAFKAEFNVTTDKDDAIGLYYTEDATTNFTADKVFWREIKGNKGYQNVVFDAPGEIVPNSLRLDFGVKVKDQQGNIILKSFKITCYNNKFEAKGSDFFKYFLKNELTETQVDEAAGTITFKQDLKKGTSQSYYPQQALLDELKKIE